MNKYKNVTAIILAGGKSCRMGTRTKKQFLEIKGKKVVEFSIDVFTKLIDDVVVVTPEKAEKTRFKSIQKYVEKSKNKYIIIHDASRPFVDQRIIEDVIKAIKEYPCAYPILDLNNSIVEDQKSWLKQTPNRDDYKHVQLPQGFQKKWLMKAFSDPGNYHIHIPEMIRRVGGKVKHITGSPWLFKITRKPDIYAAEGYLEELSGKIAIVTETKSEIGGEIEKRLDDVGVNVFSFSKMRNRRGSLIDMSRLRDIDYAIEEIYEKEKRIDILINTAELVKYTPIEKAQRSDLKSILNVNLFGAFTAAKKVLTYMKKDGVIINVTSSHSKISGKSGGIYGISKSATEYLSGIIAESYSGKGISVFTVCAPMWDKSKMSDIADKTAKIVTLCSTYNLAPLSGQIFEIK